MTSSNCTDLALLTGRLAAKSLSSSAYFCYSHQGYLPEYSSLAYPGPVCYYGQHRGLLFLFRCSGIFSCFQFSKNSSGRLSFVTCFTSLIFNIAIWCLSSFLSMRSNSIHAGNEVATTRTSLNLPASWHLFGRVYNWFSLFVTIFWSVNGFPS